MAQQAIDSIGEKTPSRTTPRPLPTLGMRGGLGKTLLISFLLLAIVPLSLLALLTYHEIQRDTRQKLVASLETVVALKEAHLIDWVWGYERELSLLADALDRHADPAAEMAAVQALDPTLTGLILVDRDKGKVLASSDHAWNAPEVVEPLLTDEKGLVIASAPSGDLQPLLAISYPWDGRQLIALPGWDALQRIVAASDASWEGSVTRLVMSNGWMLSEEGLAFVPADAQASFSQGIAGIWQQKDGSGAYDDLAGEPVFGAYRWNPALRVGILAEQSQRQALEMGNTLTALVVGATLVVALVTAAIAAVVTRRVTQPIVQLTETAAWMARGKLNQQVVISRNDEIGILARAFNRMAAELGILYDNLEAKVAERTMQLEAANEQTSYHLIQLATSAEVARVATSIRQIDSLLTTVVQLIGRAFELEHTSIYLLDENEEWAEPATQPGVRSHDHPYLPEKVKVGGPSLVGQVAADGRRRVVQADEPISQSPDSRAVSALKPSVSCEMAVPLQVRERILGVLLLRSSRLDDCGENEQIVYQSLADQISIAIENARVYAMERETVERLRELDRLQSQFLTNMSHALRTPLNSIIGFSRVLLKELDGPLNEIQSADLTAIYESGRQLLGLISDMLELSRLELGVAPFSPGEVDLHEIIEGVMATTRALARGKAVQISEDVPADLPMLFTDGQRVRQVILALLSNAVKYTDEGSIHLQARMDDGHVTISVRDMGLAIPGDELERIFAESGPPSAGSRVGDSGGDDDVPSFGLAISKRVVEKLGGQIWVESIEGTGSVFTFTLPIRPTQALNGDRGNSDAHLIRQFLAAPVFEGDDDKTRVANLLNTLLLASLMTSLVTGIVAPLPFTQPLIAVEVAGLIFLLSLVSLLLMRFGLVRVASVLFLSGLWIVFNILMLLSDGVNSPFVMTYVTLTTVAGLLLGGWAAIVVAELSVLVSLILFYAKTIDALPVPVLHMGPGPSWINLTANLIVTVAMLYLATRAMNQALRSARRSAAQLDEQRELLEETVAKRTRDLEQRAIQLATAADVGRAAASILELESLSHQVVELVRDRFGLYYAGLFLLDDTGNHAVLEAGSGEAGRIMKEQGHSLEVGGLSMVGAACARREARIALDVGEEPVRFDNPLLPETRSETTLPLVVGDRVLGALDAQSTEPAAFSEEDVTVLQLVADQVAVAVDNALKFSEEGEVLEATSPLFRVSRRLASAVTTDDIVQAILDSVAETEADGCAVARLSISPDGEIESARFLGDWDRHGASQFPVGLAFPASAWPVVLERIASFWTIDDITQEDGDGDDMRQFLSRFGGRGFVNVPLRAAGRMIGFVSIHRYEAGPFSPVSIRLYETLVDQAAVALEGARLLEEAQRRAAREQTLGRVSARMRETLDMDTVLRTAVEEIAGALGLAALDLRLSTDTDLSGSGLPGEQGS